MFKLISGLFTGLKLKFKGINCNINQGLSYDTIIERRNSGKITFLGKIYSRRGCSLRSKGVLTIGRNCSLNENVQITCHKEVKIGDDVIIGPNVVIVDHDHDYSNNNIRSNGYLESDVKIGNDVWIGANCVILRGTVIGNHCVIGAGSIIKGEIPDNTLVYQEKITAFKQIKVS